MTPMPLWGLGLLLAGVAGAGASGPSPSPQTPDPLDRVETLLAQGRVELARSALLAWWDSAFAGASRLRQQRGIWLRGLLTVDPDLAARDFRRLVLEYPGGAFSDQALFRLALWEELRGDTAQAAAHLRSLLLEYPSSPLVPAARQRLEGRGAPLHRAAGGGPGEGQRSPIPPFERDAAAKEPPSALPPAGGSPATTLVREAYGVQLGAYRNAETARVLMDRLRRAGYEPRLVRVAGSELLHVRVGEWPTREEAWAWVQELRGKGFEAILVSDVAREQRGR